MSTTLSVSVSIARIKHRSKSVVLRAVAGQSYEDTTTHDITLSRGEFVEIVTQKVLHGYLEDTLRVKMEFLDEDNNVTATVDTEMAGIVSLQAKCRYTFLNPDENIRDADISASLVTAT